MSLEDATPSKADKKKASSAKGSAVRVSSDAFRQLTAKAKDLGLTNMEYASAAITYFTRNGLDPTSQETAGLISLQAKMSEVSLEIRKQNVDIGNRLVAILRTWEANQYKFMQSQQGTLLGYLENIEVNILNHQVAVESQLLAPMMERLVRGSVETHLHRMMTEILLLKFKDKDYPFSGEELKQTNASYDGQLDQRIISHMRKLLEGATVSAPKATQKPALAVPIVGSPPKPTVPPTKPGTPAAPATTTPATSQS
jgi:hypothetical protein